MTPFLRSSLSSSAEYMMAKARKLRRQAERKSAAPALAEDLLVYAEACESCARVFRDTRSALQKKKREKRVTQWHLK